MLHLITPAEWAAAQASGRIAPPSLAAEGFVHCTDGDELMLAVANRFYGAYDGELLVVDIDESRLSSLVVRETPAHPDGRPAAAGEPLFPHVYGPVDVAAVVRVRRVVRGGGGVFVGYGDD